MENSTQNIRGYTDNFYSVLRRTRLFVSFVFLVDIYDQSVCKYISGTIL